MSIHSSLRYSSATSGLRNVFTRVERLKMLKENERWTEEQSVYGLPKVKTRLKAAKKKKKEEAPKEGAAGAAPAGGAAPAAGAAAPADAKKAEGGKKPAGKEAKK